MPGLTLPQSLLPAVEDVDGNLSCHFPSLPRFKSPPHPSGPCAAPPCSPSPHRRARPLCVQTIRRRRQASRVKYQPEPLPLHAFDKLPWIASLDVSPSEFAHSSDIADLSTLPHASSGPGPIRRQRPLLKSSPFSTPQSPSRSTHDDPDDLFHHLICNLSARNIPSRPSTPAPRFDFDPTRVTFHHLMPVHIDHDDV